MKTHELISEGLLPLTSKNASRIYWRDTINGLPPTSNRSAVYSRSQARQIFARFPKVVLVEYVDGGCKTNSQLVAGRGVGYAPKGCHVIVSSTGGKWGRSRKEFRAHS